MSGEMSGQVITFYSYKGGTGRSMALANIACLLAQRTSLAGSKGVLMIDWDLEAPGLHRYFRDKFRTTIDGDEEALRPPSEDYDQKLDQHPGLIDLFLKLEAATRDVDNNDSDEVGGDDSEPHDEKLARTIMAKANPEQFILKTDVPSLDMMKAGRFDDRYAARVSTFQWEALYNRSPWLIRSLAHYLAERYQYVLIDSRTGITDISGICTMLLPEKLVVVFTPNRQSLLGVQELVRRATKYRRQSDDLRPLAVFPLPSRIEATEPTLRDHWRLGDQKEDIPGFQPLFEKLFKEVYDLPDCDLNNYFDEVQIQHAPSYSYGEKVAVLHEKSGGRLSLPQSFETMVDWLLNHPVPWDQQQVISDDEPVTEQLKRAEATYARLSAEQQEATRRLFTRLVRLARPEEGGEDTRKRVKFADLSEAEQAVAEEWSKPRLVVIQQDEKGSDKSVEPASESLIREWRRLRIWLDEDREFLLWRQSLQADLDKWKSGGRQKPNLLVGSPLSEARLRLEARPRALNEAEKAFINEGIESINRRRKKVRLGIAAGVGLLLIAAFLISYISIRKQQEAKLYVEAAGNFLETGRNYVKSNDYHSAIAAFDEAIKRNPDLVEAYYERGLAYEHLFTTDPAIADYTEVIRLRPDYADAYFNRADRYWLKLDYYQAAADFSQAINLKYNNIGEAIYRRGRAYSEIGNFDKAIADYDVVIKMPLNGSVSVGDAYLYRGLAYLQKGEEGKAIADFQKVMEVSDNMSTQAEATTQLLQLNVKTVSQIATVPGRSQQELISALFSNQPGARLAAYRAIMKVYNNDSALVPELLSFARTRTDDEDGIYNTLVVLSHINRARLKPYVAEIQKFAQEVESIGPRIKERVNTLLSRLPG